DDLLARIIRIAEAPGAGARRVVADDGVAIGAPLAFEPHGAVAAEIALVGPQFGVLIEIVGCEDVAFERFDPFGNLTVSSGDGFPSESTATSRADGLMALLIDHRPPEADALLLVLCKGRLNQRKADDGQGRESQ